MSAWSGGLAFGKIRTGERLKVQVANGFPSTDEFLSTVKVGDAHILRVLAEDQGLACNLLQLMRLPIGNRGLAGDFDLPATKTGCTLDATVTPNLVTKTSHGFTDRTLILVTSTEDAAPAIEGDQIAVGDRDGIYRITVLDANTFTLDGTEILAAASGNDTVACAPVVAIGGSALADETYAATLGFTGLDMLIINDLHIKLTQAGGLDLTTMWGEYSRNIYRLGNFLLQSCVV
jgi:hypothetical protein